MVTCALHLWQLYNRAAFIIYQPLHCRKKKYRMPTYQYGEGWVAIANQKNYISLYTCGYHHIESFKQKHPGIKTGKGCINFKDKDSLPIQDLKAVVRHAINHPKGAST